MKKVMLAVIAGVLSWSVATCAFAGDKMTLGKKNFTIKVDAIHFKNGDTDDGLYVGAEGYTEIEKNLYLGAEVGYTSNDGWVTVFGARARSNVIFIPLEMNMKYAVRIIDHVIVSFGIGGSFSYVKEELTRLPAEDAWLFGGQGFGDLNVTIGKVILGIDGKIQFTDKDHDTGKHYSNQRLGGHIGVMF